MEIVIRGDGGTNKLAVCLYYDQLYNDTTNDALLKSQG